MTKALVATQVRISKLAEGRISREAGQGTLEYVGMIVAVAFVLALVIAAIKAAGLDTKIAAAFTSAFA